MRRSAFLCGATRTAIGKFGGTLASWTAADMGVAVVQETLRRCAIDGAHVDQLIFGNARQAGGGPNPARQISYRAGIPQEVPAYTVNQACGSGLKSVILAAQEIYLGQAEAIVAGGTESMSRVPYYAESARWGARMGNVKLVDGMYRDGFNCPLSEMVMGETAERLAGMYQVTREEQDQFALTSQQRAIAATKEGRFTSQMVPLEIADRKNTRTFATDEHIFVDASLEKMAKLQPVFAKAGSVTAANSSGITDGAASMLVASEEFVERHHLTPHARIVGYTIVGVDPHIMGIGPVPATRALLERERVTLEDIDLVELNEAFAAQVISCDRELHFDRSRLNVNGGSIALGHPIGCTGARILVTLLHELDRRRARRGLATLCISGGLGIAALVERV